VSNMGRIKSYYHDEIENKEYDAPESEPYLEESNDYRLQEWKDAREDSPPF
jgi:hypothetical protein